MGGPVAKAMLIGAMQGALESAVLFLVSAKYTFANDWFLAVMIVFANAVGLAVAVRYGVNLNVVTIAGGLGMIGGGWLGVHTIGSYEYTVPTPREQRFIRIVDNGNEREVELKDVPTETVKRIPIGAGLGLLAGWAAGALTFALAFRPKDEAYYGLPFRVKDEVYSETSDDLDDDRESSSHSRE